MINRAELLIKHGFIKEGKFENYEKNPKTGEYETKEGEKYDSKDADEDIRQPYGRSSYEPTGFPKSKKFYRLSLERYDLSLEEPYYWILEFLRQGFQEVIKIEDSFAAAENSAFFGVTQQRIGAQQDKITQLLMASGKMIKELFQMVRELRIIDERMTYYEETDKELSKPLEKRGKSAEITLKGMFVDLVQQGAKSAASVFGMARELEYITLPDLFFDAPPFKSTEELETYVKGLEANFNASVLRVLIRHLRQYMEWRKRTHQEHKTRRSFMLSYLKQHFEIVKMYLIWLKPYLRHVDKLTMKGEKLEMPEIVSAFESSMLDIELLAMNPSKAPNCKECLLLTFNYRTRPELKVVQEGYQRGPVHVGKFEVFLRVYHWTAEEVANYKKMKEKEALLLVGDVSESVQKAMASLGTALDDYLAEAEGKIKDEEKRKSPGTKKISMAESFITEFFGSKKSGKEDKKASAAKDKAIREFKEANTSSAFGGAWNCYNNFKKSHRMITW